MSFTEARAAALDVVDSVRAQLGTHEQDHPVLVDIVRSLWDSSPASEVRELARQLRLSDYVGEQQIKQAIQEFAAADDTSC